jgi:hypothetical protein
MGIRILAAVLAIAKVAAAQVSVEGIGPGPQQNSLRIKPQEVRIKPQEAKGVSPQVVVFTGDRVIPHFIDGEGWQTEITTINLENHTTDFYVLFFQDNGADMVVPVAGQGVVRGMHITLGPASSYTFQTTGTSPGLASGWALLSQTTNDSVGSFAIFRSSAPGRQPQEAVVPTVNQFSSHFVLPFDNTGTLVTGIAIANPTLNSVAIPVRIHNDTGYVIDTQSLSLGAYSHIAFALPAAWGSTAGRRGVVEFLTTGFGVGALGLRFNGAAFTSLNVLENFNWAQ